MSDKNFEWHWRFQQGALFLKADNHSLEWRKSLAEYFYNQGVKDVSSLFSVQLDMHERIKELEKDNIELISQAKKYSSQVWDLKTENEKLKEENKQLLIPAIWHEGCPDKVYGSEWFIALTTFGERVVLKALPEEYSYDYKTADDTYMMATKIKCWMQFPDSQFIPYESEITLMTAKIEKLEQQNKMLIEDLEFYADQDNFQVEGVDECCSDNSYCVEYFPESQFSEIGERARETLAKVRVGK